ncbi:MULTISPECIES: hypothetical protein [unclassified Variovorax]|uniref:hypothetical protein n=1 Tax=unclassified Variovorax TaxID=663243 RepID=UPI001BD2CE41|nr:MULTISPECIES: hypothetical protein [unclassified Variovorax]
MIIRDLSSGVARGLLSRTMARSVALVALTVVAAGSATATDRSEWPGVEYRTGEGFALTAMCALQNRKYAVMERGREQFERDNLEELDKLLNVKCLSAGHKVSKPMCRFLYEANPWDYSKQEFEQTLMQEMQALGPVYQKCAAQKKLESRE